MKQRDVEIEQEETEFKVSLRPSPTSNLVGVGRLALPRLFDLESNRSSIPD